MSKNEQFPEIRTGTSNAVLAGLWRRVLFDYGIGPTRLDDIVNQYCRKIETLDAVARSQYYGNVYTDLCSDQMTWLTFKRGLACLGVKNAVITFTLNHRRHQTRHTMVLDFGAPAKLDEDADESGQKPQTELSIFLPSIMNALGVNIATFDKLLTTYMVRHRIDPSRSKRVSARGNLKKSLLDRRLSWANFIKGLDFLTIPSFDVEITLTFHGRRKQRQLPHCESIIINDVEDLLEEMTEDDFFNPNVEEMPDDGAHHAVKPDKTAVGGDDPQTAQTGGDGIPSSGVGP